MKYIPYKYQSFAEEHIMDHPAAGLFLDMGLGKTVITLTALKRLLFTEFEVTKILVIAPKKVAEDTWISESEKWGHLKDLKLSLVLGSEKQRKLALKEKADIYIINRENVVWLVAQGAFNFDCVVIDELSSFKSAKAARFKALKQVRPLVKRVIGLTGTPAPNHLLDLWPELYLLDMGARLGKTISGYREKYFVPAQKNGHIVYSYKLGKPQAADLLGDDFLEKEIYDKIGDICISMKKEDYLDLPQKIISDVLVGFSSSVQQQYDRFEEEEVLKINDTDDISAVNAAALTGKLLQFSNGAVYYEQDKYHVVHDEKLDMLENVIEGLNGKSALIFYSFRHDLARIQQRFPDVVELKDRTAIQNWNQGKIRLLIAHPASAGHGLNLQYGGNHIIWFGIPWSLELYEQGNNRIHRPGVDGNVFIHRLICKGTMDIDVANALERKGNMQDAVMRAVKARVERYTVA